MSMESAQDTAGISLTRERFEPPEFWRMTAAGAGEAGDRRQQMEKQDGQIAHSPHRNKLAKS
jgi:hypothetical protein